MVSEIQHYLSLMILVFTIGCIFGMFIGIHIECKIRKGIK